jgi:hypothetical protein
MLHDSVTSCQRLVSPIVPPGWCFLKKMADRPWCRTSATVSASISPTAIATVVDVVGAATPKVLSSDSGMGAGSRMAFALSASRGHVDTSWCAVMAMTTACSGMWRFTALSSAVLPEKDTNRMTSPFRLSGLQLFAALKPYRSDVPEVAVDGLGRVQEGARHAQALQRRDELHSNVGALANAAHDELAFRLLRRDDGIYSGGQRAPSVDVGLIQSGGERQRGSLDRENVHGARQRRRFLGRLLVG